MATDKTDIEQVLDQPYPEFLELMNSDPETAMAKFERCARSWLASHPTPLMQSLTAAEQEDVIDETIARCTNKNGEPLRNYSNMWGSFGKWLESVAESTCSTQFPKRTPKPRARAREDGSPSAGRPADVPAPAPKPAAAAAPASKRNARAAARPALSLGTLLAWLRSPLVLAPIAIVAVIVAIGAFQSSRGPSARGPVTTGPIDIALLGDGEAQNAQYDALELDHIPASAHAAGRVPMTAVFRSGRLTVLRLSTSELAENSLPNRLVVVNKAGEIAWDSPIDPESMGAGAVNLRIDPGTIVPDEYTIQVKDAADVVLLTSAFTIVAQ
jgi:hypothetical protein